METTAAYKYSFTSVVVFGILGNILVIISILRQRNLLKNNYYLLVLHLAVCDLAWLVVFIFTYVRQEVFIGRKDPTLTYCLFFELRSVFHIAGVYMMLMISVLRYYATVYPLKPDVNRRKLKSVCGLGYILGVIAGYGVRAPICFLQREPDKHTIYEKFNYGYKMFFYHLPTVVMAVLYYKVYRALMNQNEYLKSLGSDAVPQSSTRSSYRIANYIKNHRTLLVCVTTVLCYGIGNLPKFVSTAWRIACENNQTAEHKLTWHIAIVLRVVGSCSVNPLIYGILDKKLLKFWKICSKR